MTQKNQNEKPTIDFIEVNGTGTILTGRGYVDTDVLGYFKRYNWWFMVHRDIVEPDMLTVSEASTGRCLKDELYPTVEDALYYALPFIDQKRYYFATRVGDALVAARCNLLYRNTTCLQTLAINSVLW